MAPARTRPPEAGSAWGLAVALLAGAAMCAFWGNSQRWTPAQLAPIMAAAALGTLPPVRRRFEPLAGRLRHPAQRTMYAVACAVTLVAGLILIVPPLLLGYQFFPAAHDEQAYVVQTQMLARGQLWMPAHEVGEFFETFFVLHRPVYASIYFPGTALLFVPMVWFDLPYWALPVLYSSIAVGLFYLVITELIDGVYGLLAAMLLLSCTMFRHMALGIMSHEVMLLLGVAMVWTTLRWRASAAVTWAIVAGALAGLAAITRPVDALCYAVPLAFAVWPKWKRLPGPRRRALPLIVAVGAGAPFLALQTVFNMGVTGRAFLSPYQLYLHQDQPGSGYGFFDAARYGGAWPKSQLVQKHLYHDQFIRPDVLAHRPEAAIHTFSARRAPLLVSTTLPHPLVALLIPLSTLGLRGDRRRIAVWLTLPALIVGYTFNPFLLSHYLVVWLPPVLFVVLLGGRALETSRPWARLRLGSALIPLALVGSVVSAQPGLNPVAIKRWEMPILERAGEQLARLPHLPAVVLFRYYPGNGFNAEPVYNVDVAWPDDAPVVRAHDLGEHNVAIVHYYAKQRPERYFYLYDLEGGELHPLGRATELLARMTGRAIATSHPAVPRTHAPTAPDAGGIP